MASKMDFHIMISYNQKSGTDCMNKLLTELKRRGYKVWVDVEQMHGEIYKSMAEGIASSFIIVPLVSEAYELSPYCGLELKHAQTSQKAIIPVKIEDYRPPKDSWLSLIISHRRYYKIFGDFDETDELIVGIEKELKKCKTDLQPTKKSPTQESASNMTQTGPEDQNSSFGSSHHPEDEEQDLQPTKKSPTQESASNMNQNYGKLSTSMTDERSDQQNEGRMASKMEFHIMISYYQKRGADCMNKLLTELRKRDYKVWVDVEQMHGKFYNCMAEGIASSFVFVPLVSEAYELSDNCELQLKHAQLIRKAIIPVKIEDYQPPKNSWLLHILSDRSPYKIFGNVDETENLVVGIEKELKKCKTDLQPTKKSPTQESASNMNQRGTEDQNSSSGSSNHPEDEEQALQAGVGSMHLTPPVDEGQFNANDILNDRALLLKIADSLEPYKTNGLESLALLFDCTTNQVAQIMRGSEPARNFFTSLAQDKGGITLNDLKKVIEGGSPLSRNKAIFSSIIADINSLKVGFTLDSTLEQLFSKGKYWHYFLENVADKLPSNNVGISWEDVAGHYKYTNTEINNLRMGHSGTTRPTEVFFEILSQRERVPKITTLKENLSQLKRYDVIRVIDAWLQKPKN